MIKYKKGLYLFLYKMALQLLSIKPQYLVEDSDLDLLAAVSPEFSEARESELEKCISEDKWHLSRKARHDVGEGVAEEHFMDNYFPGWDDGFRAAYFSSADGNSGGERHSYCLNKDYFEKIRKALGRFLEKFKRNNRGNAEADFYSKYFNGWAVGFRVGYCGCVCADRDNCGIADKYILLNSSEWPPMNDVY